MVSHSLSLQCDRFHSALQTDQCFAVFNSQNIIGRFQNLHDLIQKRSKYPVKIISFKIIRILEIFRQCLASCCRKGHSTAQKIFQKQAICFWFLYENFCQFHKCRNFSVLTPKTEAVHNMQSVQHGNTAHGKGFRTGSAYGHRHLKYEIRTTPKCHFCPYMLWKKCRCAPLYIISAHSDDHIICPQFFFAVIYLIFMSFMKRIILRNDSGYFHLKISSVIIDSQIFSILFSNFTTGKKTRQLKSSVILPGLHFKKYLSLEESPCQTLEKHQNWGYNKISCEVMFQALTWS